jgi:TrmH family RNA methyltransferase
MASTQPQAAATIASRTNPRVKQLRAAFTGHARLSGGLVAIEGAHLIEEALRSGLLLKALFLSESTPTPTGLPHTLEQLRLTDELFRSLVETQSPQGIAALLLPPTHTLHSVLTPCPLVIVAAGLQDPGNLGTLIRSAEAFAASGVLTSPGTVSPWNQKALRASAGSLFRLPVASATLEEVAALKQHGLRLYAAVAPGHPNAIDPQHADLSAPVAILLGNEGAGLSPEWLRLADAPVSIPCPGPVESLTAAIAGSLLLYEASRQRTQAKSPSRP